MIRYRLKCDEGHSFEAWFKGSEAFDKQAKRGLVECPACGGTDVSKDIMAPAVPKKGGVSREHEVRAEEVAREILQSVGAARKHVEENCDYVGPAFAEEARKIHHGETEERGIYGEASLDDARELTEEGIEVHPLPTPPRRN
ncbi:MAG: DUF1178 family protein [Rhodospirillales bacterium]